MIPLWKLKRELGRLVQQLRILPEAIWEPIAQRRHDRLRGERVAVAEGDVTNSGKVAIFLIYQPQEIAGSVIETCRYLRRKGFAPLVVSNATVSDTDRKRLLPHVWKLAVRPNFGYDFGGYRDGLWVIDEAKAELEALLILNDSVWFPIYSDVDLIDRAEALDCDIAGTNLRNRTGERFLESYFYYIPARVLRSEAFREYWSGLKLTANKYKVIRRGERGFSRAMLVAGFKLSGVFDPAAFVAKLREADEPTLRATLRYAAFLDQSTAADFAAMLDAPSSPDWHQNTVQAIEAALQRYPFYSCFPYAGHKLMGYPLLKRSGDRTAIVWRKAFDAAVTAGELPPPLPPFHAEIRKRISTESE